MSKERRHRQISMVVTIVLQVVMLLLFYYLVAWKEPFPPIPTYGIELDFGFTNTGKGAEPVDVSAESESIEALEPPAEQETQEELTDAVEPQQETIEEPEAANPTDVMEEMQTYEDAESPDVLEEIDSSTTEEVSEPEANEAIASENQPEPNQETQPQVNGQALMGNTSESNPASQGDNEPGGDQGKEEGTIDGRAIYGTQGTSEGVSLQMSGWVWDFKPDPKDDSDEYGKIVFRIKIDADGYLVDIDRVTSTVSPEVEYKYKRSIERLSFSKTNDYKSAPFSTGTVTFIIKSK